MGFRLEDKIRFHISDYSKLKKEIIKKKGGELYPKRVISSTYFDTKNFDMFLDSEEGNVPRKKIRLRVYPNTKEKKFFLEKKINSVEGKFKKSSKLNSQDYDFYIQNGSFEPGYGLIEKKIIISYIREYFMIENVRLTLDYNITFKDTKGYESYTDQESLILEIKSKDQIIEIQNKFSNIIPLRRERFSKYCEGINKLFNKSHFQRLHYVT